MDFLFSGKNFSDYFNAETFLSRPYAGKMKS